MMIPTRWIPAALLACVTILGCSESVEPGDPPGPAAIGTGLPAPRGRLVTPDDERAEFATQAPGFGGTFVDAKGRETVFLKDIGRSSRLEPAIRAFLRHRGGGNGAIAYRHGEYGYDELKTWVDQAADVLLEEGVVYTDIDETANRVSIGVTSFAGETRARAFLARRGLPSAAFRITPTDTPVEMVGLSEIVLPIPGGLRINFDKSDGQYYCTQLPVGYGAGFATAGLVTNSHCSKVKGGEEGTVYYGYDRLTGLRQEYGVEYSDPNWINYGGAGGCPLGQKCRYSDALLIDLDPGIGSEVGHIARPTGAVNSGSTTIDTGNPFVITSEGGVPGGTMNKVGMTSGWTAATRNQTCVNMATGTPGYYLWCQYGFYSSSNVLILPGDSGSPVFVILGDGTVKLVGIAWGSNSGGHQVWFSSWDLLEGELGSLHEEF